jgi:predicted O-methyltransferase YrrM
LPKLKQGGFVLADKTLWSGKVLDKKIKSNDYFTKGIIEFNNFIKQDSRVDKVILPIRDGITILRKR